MAAPVQHHDPVAMGPYVSQPLGYQQISAGSMTAAAGTGLTLPGDNVITALIQVEGIAGIDFVRWRDDGVAPSTTVGMRLDPVLVSAGAAAGGLPLIYSGNLNAILFISAGGTPKLNISYYR